MAIAKLLHEGETIKQLKNIIRYNTVAKEYLNSPDNPRLLQAISNLGVIDISDSVAYKDFMRGFIDEITMNQSLSTNKRQKKLYAHEVISFEDEDNARFNQDELAQISIELLSELYDMKNTPYIIWPQTDSGRLHFHFVRSMYSSDGSYQRVKNSKRRMRQSCEKMELKYNLTRTGNNASDEIRPANNPMSKVMKNRQLEAEYKHQDNLNEAVKQDSTFTKFKRKSYDLLMNDQYQNEDEKIEQAYYQQVKQDLSERTQLNEKLESVKQTIIALYKSAHDENDFISLIEKQGIGIEILKHAKSGTNRGIAFHYQGETISGGKISSSMTLGKIKKRFPSFIHALEKPPSLRATYKTQHKMLDFHIEQINKYYNQRKNNANNDILIYFSKKNIEARPFNYNLKLSSTRDTIHFGPSTPNNHDLTLSIEVALENDWKGATLTNSSPAFLKRMMKAAYKKDPKLLFFIKSDQSNQLTYADLKEIKSPLTIHDLKNALKHQIITENDLTDINDDLHTLLKSEAETPSQMGYLLALEAGFRLEVLDNKTIDELQRFYHRKSFQESDKNTVIEASEASDKSSNDRDNCLNDLISQSSIDPTLDKPLTSNTKYSNLKPK